MITSTQTATLTKEATVTKTAITTAYPAEKGEVLLTDRGLGNKDTKPFTLEKKADIKITLTIKATVDLRFVTTYWYLL